MSVENAVLIAVTSVFGGWISSIVFGVIRGTKIRAIGRLQEYNRIVKFMQTHPDLTCRVALDFICKDPPFVE